MPRRPDPENIFRFTKNTATSVALGPGQAERTVWDAEMPGFGLRLRAAGSTVWIVRRPGQGLHALGPTTRLNLTEARSAAREFLAAATLGRPMPSRRERVPTFKEMVDRYVDRTEKRDLARTTVRDLKRQLVMNFADLHSKRISEVTRRDVADSLTKIMARSGLQTANRGRSILSTFFVWCIGEGVTETNPVIGTNKPAPNTVRDRVLTDDELMSIWRAASVITGDFGIIVKILILTAQRRSEVAEMTWPEVNQERALWLLPGARVKNGRANPVPLSEPVLALLRDRPAIETREFVFGTRAGPFSGFSKAKAELDAICGVVSWTLHDLRRTASTGMNSIGVQPHVVEAILNHVSGSKAGVAGVYNWATYMPERTSALRLWSEHVLALCEPRLEVASADAQAALTEA